MKMQNTQCFRGACHGKAYPNHDEGCRIMPPEPGKFPGALERPPPIFDREFATQKVVDTGQAIMWLGNKHPPVDLR